MSITFSSKINLKNGKPYAVKIQKRLTNIFKKQCHLIFKKQVLVASILSVIKMKNFRQIDACGTAKKLVKIGLHFDD